MYFWWIYVYTYVKFPPMYIHCFNSTFSGVNYIYHSLSLEKVSSVTVSLWLAPSSRSGVWQHGRQTFFLFLCVYELVRVLLHCRDVYR